MQDNTEQNQKKYHAPSSKYLMISRFTESKWIDPLNPFPITTHNLQPHERKFPLGLQKDNYNAVHVQKTRKEESYKQ